MQKVILGIVAMGLIFGGAYYWNQSQETSMFASLPDGAVGNAGAKDIGAMFFYGAECSHCKDVESFIDDSNLLGKIRFEKWEVWHNKENSNKMMDKVKVCGLDSTKIGVPFLFAEGKCYVGTPDVEAYFKKAAGL
jgi:glutaredoxin